MARLIEVPDPQTCPTALAVRAGDVLLVHATGGRVESGGDAVELLGPFLPAVLGDDGSVLAPQGLPNTVLLRARRPGRARVEVVTADFLHDPRAATLDITVRS